MLNEWMKKLDRLFENRRILFTFAFLAIFVESFSSVLLKMGGLYPVMSLGWAFFFCAAVGVMGIYAIMWQFLLEKLPAFHGVSAQRDFLHPGLYLGRRYFW